MRRRASRPCRPGIPLRGQCGPGHRPLVRVAIGLPILLWTTAVAPASTDRRASARLGRCSPRARGQSRRGAVAPCDSSCSSRCISRAPVIDSALALRRRRPGGRFRSRRCSTARCGCSYAPPSAPETPTGAHFVPGAVLFAVGRHGARDLIVLCARAVCIFTGRHVRHARARAALLLGLFLIARLVVAAAVLNATLVGAQEHSGRRTIETPRPLDAGRSVPRRTRARADQARRSAALVRRAVHARHRDALLVGDLGRRARHRGAAPRLLRAPEAVARGLRDPAAGRSRSASPSCSVPQSVSGSTTGRRARAHSLGAQRKGVAPRSDPSSPIPLERVFRPAIARGDCRNDAAR